LEATVLEIVEAPCVDRVVARGRVESICPVSGVVDNYLVEVEYKPPQGRGVGVCRYVEAYSLHRLFQSFREKRILQEELTAVIAEELCKALGPGAWVRVATRGPHGPIELEASTERRCTRTTRTANYRP
jgi:NADPH-dependent 7-cyano-7-deazaguanine reductase QueF